MVQFCKFCESPIYETNGTLVLCSCEASTNEEIEQKEINKQWVRQTSDLLRKKREEKILLRRKQRRSSVL